MRRPKSPYSIHLRPTKKKNRWVYYAQFRNKDGGYTSAVSTGCTRRDDAVRWCEKTLAEGADQRENVTLAQYAKGFWKSDAAFATDRAAHGRAVSNGYLDISESFTRNHLLPTWGEWKLGDITAGKLDAWIVELHRQRDLAPATINKLIQALRIILERAVVDGWMAENPADHVRPVRAPHTQRTVLTAQEALRLLAGPEPWAGYRHYAINVLAATTGIRMGEVRALLVENVKADHIEIRHSWEQGYGPRPPKADSIRDIPISAKVFEILSRVASETEPTILFFYGRNGKDIPMSKNAIEENLSRALSNIGISREEQRERFLGFHAWRHFLNSVMRSNGVPDAKTRRITGHRTEAMTSRYTDWKAVDISGVVAIQTHLLVLLCHKLTFRAVHGIILPWAEKVPPAHRASMTM